MDKQSYAKFVAEYARDTEKMVTASFKDVDTLETDMVLDMCPFDGDLADNQIKHIRNALTYTLTKVKEKGSPKAFALRFMMRLSTEEIMDD